MKFAPMNYHYLRYPIKKFLDKVERSPFNSIDLYCSAPQLNLFDYPLTEQSATGIIFSSINIPLDSYVPISIPR